MHNPAGTDAWLQSLAQRRLSDAELSRLTALFESQRQAILMFASCAWFFEDVAGIETVQALRHAARAIELSQQASGPDDTERRFIALLALAQSNDPSEGTGADVYARHARRARPLALRLRNHASLSLRVPRSVGEATLDAPSGE